MILEMSEVQIVESTTSMDQNIKMDETENKISEAIKSQPEVDETAADLEDGEIDDDDENSDDADVIITSVGQANDPKPIASAKLNEKPKTTNDDIVTIDLLDDSCQQSPPNVKQAKSKKSKPLDDDHASSIEHALANALKKKGIQPMLPVLDSRNIQDEQTLQQAPSRSSRRRKRKKQREEKEKQKNSSEKKKSRYESPDSTKPKIHEIEDDDGDDLMEDYEMLNVRGGSPPPVSHLSHPMMPAAYKDQYDSVDDSNYSYDSYDSGNDVESTSDNRRKRRNKKDKESRKRRGGRNRNDGERQEKNNRRGDSPDHQEPRKLELCKFYLMECCAKRDKCSYMHSDFPCKYYYLGMECQQKEDCKFGHGEPLTEQLRNILLKHLETAPKEILGNFKRISREQAIAQMTKRHEELCQKFNVQNVWSIFPYNNRRGGNNDHQQNQQLQQHHNNQQQQQQQQQQLQLQQQLQIQQQIQLQLQQNPMLHNIPSLLDLDIKPPTNDLMDLAANVVSSTALEKPRKSRWCDNLPNDVSNSKNRTNVEPPPNNPPSYLDLKNLKGILSEEHIQQLSELGIVNLEQVNQLTVGQLNKIGLTIAEINEIQLNAKNMAKLGVPVGANETLNVAILNTASIDKKSSPKTDQSLMDETTAPVTKSLQEESMNSNSNSNSGVIMVDYSQYLKDSNLPYERGDDDERDDEQLIIDDGNTDNDESPFGTPSKFQNRNHNKDEKKRKDSLSDSEHQHQPPLHSFQNLQMPDFTNALRNPFNSISVFNKPQHDPRISSSSHIQNNMDVFKPNKDDRLTAQKKSTGVDTDSDDERYYASRGRRSRSVTPTRSGGSSTPEGSPSPKRDSFSGPYKPRTNPKYGRNTMYDYDIKRVLEEDAAHAAKAMKADKDMRFMEGAGVGSGDIDLRLPFLPVTNYTPATEIDGSITSHLPMTYKVYEVDIPLPNYVELRQNFKSDQTSDPRLRRILGLPETPTSRTAVELSRSVRKHSNTIASPESSDSASPKYYTPSMSTSISAADERSRRSSHSHNQRASEHLATTTAPTQTGTSQLRLDPRRAARQAVQSSSTASTAQNSPPVTTAAPNNANKQNVEIRNYLQKSEWYKNLNSKFKIMVNQQLALVSTELKKFHQDPSPTKIFDISFIVNNSTLQQILTNLGVYIDDNGEVAHIDGDGDESEQDSQNVLSNKNIVLPNLSQPPPIQSQPQPQQPQQQLDFLRAPPPNMFGQAVNVQQFNTPPPNTRPSLLGIPPVVAPGVPRNPFNPFASNVPVPVPFASGPPSLLGPGPAAVTGLNAPVNFGNFGAPNMQQKRNFSNNNNRNNQQRNQRQRRNNFNSASGNA